MPPARTHDGGVRARLGEGLIQNLTRLSEQWALRGIYNLSPRGSNKRGADWTASVGQDGVGINRMVVKGGAVALQISAGSSRRDGGTEAGTGGDVGDGWVKSLDAIGSACGRCRLEQGEQISPYRHALPITTLMASKPSRSELLLRALDAVHAQTRPADQLIVVFDRTSTGTSAPGAMVHDRLLNMGAVVLTNTRSQGAAGTWNTGLSWLQDQRFDGYVAILDDDDEWDSDHLKQCESASLEGRVDVVLSGLRVVKDGVELPRAPLSSVSRDDFLSGNPGWQGSNTFVKSRAIERVGGFTDGLPSTNDRDLAVRLLGLPDLTTAFTGRMTASWHLSSHGDGLSRAGSPEKRAGLLQFFAMHRHLMSSQVETRFRTRARELFGVDVP